MSNRWGTAVAATRFELLLLLLLFPDDEGDTTTWTLSRLRLAADAPCCWWWCPLPDEWLCPALVSAVSQTALFLLLNQLLFITALLLLVRPVFKTPPLEEDEDAAPAIWHHQTLRSTVRHRLPVCSRGTAFLPFSSLSSSGRLPSPTTTSRISTTCYSSRYSSSSSSPLCRRQLLCADAFVLPPYLWSYINRLHSYVTTVRTTAAATQVVAGFSLSAFFVGNLRWVFFI